MNYKELQTKFEKEVRQEIKKINKEFAVNIHTYPNIYIEFLTQSMTFTNEEQDKIVEYIKQIEMSYEIINRFKNKYDLNNF